MEVKTRQTDEYGNPDIAVTKQKQRYLISEANVYVFQNKLDIDIRFDIISIFSGMVSRLLSILKMRFCLKNAICNY